MRVALVSIALVLLACGCKSSEREQPMAAAARACPDSELGCARPIFSVRDLGASLAYFRDQLGFKVDWTDGEPADFGSVSRSELTVFLCQQCQGRAGAWLWAFAKDVDALHAELVHRGATIRRAPFNAPYGMREMQVTDRDGNVLRFASAIDK